MDTREAYWAGQLAIAERTCCTRPDKIGYQNKAAAKQKLRALEGIRRAKLRAYRCRCGFYHLGNRP